MRDMMFKYIPVKCPQLYESITIYRVIIFLKVQPPRNMIIVIYLTCVEVDAT